MKTINLDNDFKPFDSVLTPEVFVKQFDFPSGCEPHVKIPGSFLPNDNVMITTRIRNISDLFLIALTVDTLKRMGVHKIHLFIPYLPFARQDRVMVPGEPLSIKVVCDFINSMKLKKVIVFDVHSEVSLALLNNVENITNHGFVTQVLQNKSNYLLVSPDAGAYKKIFKLAQCLNYTDEIVLCNKTRNVATGEITSVFCPVDDFKGKDLYIVDDICDGGGTFLLLADELRKRNCGEINLIVSHGIFSRGFETLLEKLNNIYTTNSFYDVDYKNVIQIKLKLN